MRTVKRKYKKKRSKKKSSKVILKRINKSKKTPINRRKRTQINRRKNKKKTLRGGARAARTAAKGRAAEEKERWDNILKDNKENLSWTQSGAFEPLSMGSAQAGLDARNQRLEKERRKLEFQTEENGIRRLVRNWWFLGNRGEYEKFWKWLNDHGAPTAGLKLNIDKDKIENFFSEEKEKKNEEENVRVLADLELSNSFLELDKKDLRTLHDLFYTWLDLPTRLDLPDSTKTYKNFKSWVGRTLVEQSIKINDFDLQGWFDLRMEVRINYKKVSALIQTLEKLSSKNAKKNEVLKLAKETVELLGLPEIDRSKKNIEILNEVRNILNSLLPIYFG